MLPFGAGVNSAFFDFIFEKRLEEFINALTVISDTLNITAKIHKAAQIDATLLTVIFVLLFIYLFTSPLLISI